MDNATWQLFKNCKKQIIRARVVTGVANDGTPVTTDTVFTDSDLAENSFSVDKYVCQNVFSLGEVTANEVTATINKSYAELSSEIGSRYGDIWIYIECGIKNWGSDDFVTWIPLGVYSPYEMTPQGKSTTVIFWDRMGMMDLLVDKDTLPESGTPKEYIEHFCEKVFGSTLPFAIDESRTLITDYYEGTSFKIISSAITGNYTYRMLLSDVAEMLGGNAMFDSHGNLALVYAHLPKADALIDTTYNDWQIIRPAQRFSHDSTKYGVNVSYLARVEVHPYNGGEYAANGYIYTGYIGDVYNKLEVKNNVFIPDIVNGAYASDEAFYDNYLSELAVAYAGTYIAIVDSVTVPMPFVEPCDRLVWSGNNALEYEDGFLKVRSVVEFCAMHVNYELNRTTEIVSPIYIAASSQTFTQDQQKVISDIQSQLGKADIDKNVSFVKLPLERMIGDVYDHGTVNSTDYMLIRRHIYDVYPIDPLQLYYADINGDGNVDLTDYDRCADTVFHRGSFGLYTDATYYNDYYPSGYRYYVDIKVDGVTTTDNVLVTVLTNDTKASTLSTEVKIPCNGRIRLYCNEPPTFDMALRVDIGKNGSGKGKLINPW